MVKLIYKSGGINMYFKDQLEEFKENFDFKKMLIPIIIAVIFIIGIALIIFGNRSSRIISYEYQENYYITLIGDSRMTIYLGDEYNEPGYRASNSKGKDLTSSVVTEGTVNTNKVGEYTIKYMLQDTAVTRTVIVLEKEKGSTVIHLLGDLVIYLKIGEKYVEPGYEVIDTKDGDSLKDKVKIDNPVNTSKVGVYKITYSVVNSSGITTSKQRTVIVMDSEVSLTLDNNNYTNDSVNINIYVKDTYYDHMILPNGNKITENKYTYSVSENGTYKFTIYNVRGDYREATITVNNINKTKPTGSCTGEYRNGTSTVKINATDDIGIAKYVINGNAYATNEITVSGETENINVTIYDKAGNNNTISCNLEDKNPIIINGSCSGSYKNGTSTINVTASSNRGISKYVINGTSYTSSPITIKGELSSVKVTIYDGKNNTKDITCKLEDKNVYGDIKNVSTKPPIKKSDNVYLGYYGNFSFWIYFPDKMRANLPVILFMGGLGERGDDYVSGTTAAINLGPIQDVLEFGIKPDAIIIHAQCPGGNQYVYSYLSSYIQLVNKVVSEFKANSKKISVMGFSHGCYGLMHIVYSNQQYFSAAVPIGCNPGNYGNPSNFASTPVWAFAGSGEGVSSFPGWVQQINNLGGNARFTRPPLHEHNVLRLDYSILRDDDYKVIDWMISQTRS